MKLHRIFTSHMVFAAGKPIRIWGEGSGIVSVSFAGQSRSADADGRWEIDLSPMPYGGPYEMHVSLNGTETSSIRSF